MNKRTWSLLLFAFISALLITAPASVLSPVLLSASNGRIELANTRGTIWNGSASPLLHQGNGGLITLSPLHWEIAILQIFSGKITVLLNWDNGEQTQPMNVIVTADQVELQHIYIPLPAILLDEASNFLKPAALRGQVFLKSDSLIINKQGVEGAATADWLNASSLLSNISPLGNYHFVFFSNATGLKITLNTTSGALLLSGQGHFSTSSGLDFKGTAQAANGKEEALHELLSHLGPQERPGVNTFTLVPQISH